MGKLINVRNLERLIGYMNIYTYIGTLWVICVYLRRFHDVHKLINPNVLESSGVLKEGCAFQCIGEISLKCILWNSTQKSTPWKMCSLLRREYLRATGARNRYWNEPCLLDIYVSRTLNVPTFIFHMALTCYREMSPKYTILIPVPVSYISCLNKV